MSTPEERAWRIQGGEIELLKLPRHPECFYVPEKVRWRDAGTSVQLISGRHDPNFEVFTLPIVADIAARLTPWSTWYWSPSTNGRSCWGAAWGLSEVAVCHSRVLSYHAISTAFHEAWHLAEDQMNEETLTQLDERMRAGPAWPDEWFSDVNERRARAFEHFCMLMEEGCRQVVSGPAAPFEIELFYNVYSGDFGREIMDLRAQAARIDEQPKRSKFSKMLALIGV